MNSLTCKSLLILLVLMIILGNTVFKFPPQLSAINPNNNGKIAFTSDRDGNHEIYIMDADGSNQTRITSDLADDAYPVWSPDGKKIAFSSDRAGRTWDNWGIYIMNSDGSNASLITPSGKSWCRSAWAPDGGKIAYYAGDWSGAIYVMNADGSEQIKLADVIASSSYPSWSAASGIHLSWSPDGAKIAFHTHGGQLNTAGIYVIGRSTMSRLTHNLTIDFSPSWSPDGQKIAFHSNREGNADIYIMNADGSQQVRMTSNARNNYCPVWSPGGEKIAFYSDRDGNYEIYVMHADGSNQTRLTFNSSKDTDPSWQAIKTPEAAGGTIAEHISNTPNQPYIFLFAIVAITAFVVFALIGKSEVKTNRADHYDIASSQIDQKEYCFDCGAEMPTGSKFCKKCGEQQ